MTPHQLDEMAAHLAQSSPINIAKGRNTDTFTAIEWIAVGLAIGANNDTKAILQVLPKPIASAIREARTAIAKRGTETTHDAAEEHPAVALLREIEWSGEDNVCPCCGEHGPHPTLGGGPTPGTHRDDCKLAAILAGR